MHFGCVRAKHPLEPRSDSMVYITKILDLSGAVLNLEPRDLLEYYNILQTFLQLVLVSLNFALT